MGPALRAIVVLLSPLPMVVTALAVGGLPAFGVLEPLHAASAMAPDATRAARPPERCLLMCL